MNYLINQVLRDTTRESGAVKKRAKAVLFLIVSVLTVACASVPHTGRRQFNFVSDSQMNQFALKAFQHLLETEKESSDERLKEMVKRVADRVGKAAETIDSPKFDWDVRLIEKDVPNAFCLPGGKIVVFTGILPYAKNEAGLSAIVAHEVAHAVARHGGERMSQQLALKGAVLAGGEVLKKKDGKIDQKTKMLLGALGLGATVGVILPYSRTHEFEADQIGQMYMARAGYDPAEAVKLWRRMSKIKKPPIPVWLSTHPADDDRVRKLAEHLPEAGKHYSEAPVKSGRGGLL
ncbi:MAG: M48 family metallopeptidase [Pseudomonadota bacterium]